ncbi:MAG TPA: flavin reductase family protein [Verrucomicrobiales bacterium]|nr:flavin reductase family protein [Verrucomicrobiales bacterium]
MDRERVGAALGTISSGLYIVTGHLDGEPTGMLCSFLEQASFSPPMLTLALRADRRLAQALQESGRVGINVLGEDDQDLMRRFANPNNTDPFAGISVEPEPADLPRLSGALAFLAATLRGTLDAGDHRVHLLEITDGCLQNPAGRPMIRVRRNGFQY